MISIITPQYVEYLWTFDSTYQDLSATFNGTPINGPEFNSSTITGYGSSLSLTIAARQSVTVSGPFLNLNNCSWTFEAWIYPVTLNSSTIYGIIGQCQLLTVYQCFHLNIRQGKLLMGFYFDDLNSTTPLMTFQWYHIAFVFNTVNRSQSIYLNGLLDSSRMANSVYRGRGGSLTFGSTLLGASTRYFDGLLDQVYYTSRVKTSAEILDDATLTLYFSFDNGSAYDSGPLRINGSLVGSTSKVTGRVGDAIHFGSNVTSYFRVNGLVLLGTSNQSYSMSIWIKPAVIRSSSIIHVSSRNDGSGWCVGMLGLDSTGRLITFYYKGVSVSVPGPILSTNSWTHAAVTYSSSNGLRLYVNGTLHNFSAPFTYDASNSPNYLFLSSGLGVSHCTGINGQYEGVLDEFRLYSRELTAYDICILSHP